jgi:hypothetical protein
MKKRTFLQALLATGGAVLVTERHLRPPQNVLPPILLAPPPAETPPAPAPVLVETTAEAEMELMLLQ